MHRLFPSYTIDALLLFLFQQILHIHNILSKRLFFVACIYSVRIIRAKAVHFDEMVRVVSCYGKGFTTVRA
jgi:hypothetical protein